MSLRILTVLAALLLAIPALPTMALAQPSPKAAPPKATPPKTAPKPAPKGTPGDPSPADAQQYAACMQLARNDPRQAFTTANAWYDKGGGVAAQHCAAVSLFNSGDYIEAANRLEHLAQDGLTVRQDLRAGLYAQAGQAWLRASLIDQALRAQNNALLLAPDNVEYLIDRSVTRAGIGQLDDAIADLSHALKVSPRKYEALTLRATAYRLQAKTVQAANDIDQAIRLAPDYPEAYLERGIQRRMRGARDPAHDDFVKVLRLVPKESDLAVQAGKELQQMDLKK